MTWMVSTDETSDSTESLRTSQNQLRQLEEELAAEVTRREEAEAGLARVSRQLQQATESRSAFVAAVCHELRNPLTAIGNAVRVLRDETDGDEVVRFVDLIDRNRRRLVDLVGDLLDLASVESGRFEVSPGPLDLYDLLHRVVELFEDDASQRAVSLVVRTDGELPPVLADQARVEQVLGNLVSNALAACDAGGRVVLEARAAPAGVELSVEDTGSGLPADDRELVFEPFYRGNALRYRGSGLGLAISRDLVLAHGSDLHVVSKLGSGSRFAFFLPVDSEQGRESLMLERTVRSLQGLRSFELLVVELHVRREPRTVTLDRELLDELHHRVAARLRSSDHVVALPRAGQLVIALTEPTGQAARRVRFELEEVLRSVHIPEGLSASVAVHGPVRYPEDGRNGRQLVTSALREAGP